MTSAQARLTAALADRYRLERELGQGGMATVYLAEDLKHGRKVAIKVLHPELSAVIGGDRFLSEIKTTASLQHPHILGLIDSGEADGLLYYVMPFIEGETLRARLAREKQLSIDDAIRLTKEVASALEFAHKRGIVHRDIKPENILLQDGQALVADFGIALAVQQAGGSRMTQTGMSLGTPAYMSPEQAMGDRDVNSRSDVYALGAMTYEMLTGEPPFTGLNSQAIVAKVLTETPPPLRPRRPMVSAAVEHAVLVALQKLPADRFGSAKDFADALDDKGGTYAPTVSLTSRPHVLATSRRGRVLAVLAVAAIATAAGTVGWLLHRPPTAPVRPLVRFDIQLPRDVQAVGATGSTIAVAPDGSQLVYVGKAPAGQRLYVRYLDRPEPVAIAGSDGASLPFFSPDGQWVGFRQGDELARVTLAGGPVSPITRLNGVAYGATWAPGDTVIFSSDSGLMEVPVAGGTARLIARPDSGEAFRFPEVLPDGRTVLFGVMSGGSLKLAALTRRTGIVKRFQQLGGYPRYVDQGFVVLSNSSGSITAVPFDARRLEVTGPAISLTGQLTRSIDGDVNLGVSRAGDLAFQASTTGGARLVLLGRDGAMRQSGAETGFFFNPRLSPDGRRVVMSQAADFGASSSDVWVFDLAQRTQTRITFDTTDLAPLWSPDGSRIAYARHPQGLYGQAGHIYWVLADGSARPESLLAQPGIWRPSSFTPDGRGIVYHGQNSTTSRFEIWRFSPAASTPPEQLLASNFDNTNPSLSPDGHWFAYASNESGRNEIYVRPFPGPGGRWQVSLDGGTEPLWSPAGGEIFYRNGDRMMAASVRTQGGFEIGDRKLLFTGEFAVSPFRGRNYDVTRDGQTFFLLQPLIGSAQAIVVTLNWFENLPSKR